MNSLPFKSEGEFISRVRRWARRPTKGLSCGIGDDTAVFEASPGQRWCITTDLLIEGVHFDLRFDSERSVGHKSLASGLSDIAAMGATPKFALVSIALPKNRRDFLIPFYRGMLALADRHGVSLIGGDTSRSGSDIFLDVVVLGTVPRGCEILRSGARKGDHVFVTGSLGKAAFGLNVLRSGKSRGSPEEKRAVDSHRFPAPRTAVGRWLGKKRIASAMIDVSDGLSTDLHHLCEESHVGARIDELKIPLPVKRRSAAIIQFALSGGEDYELLFTVPAGKVKRVPKKIEGVPVWDIGAIVPRRKGVTIVRSDGQVGLLPMTGWDHFR